MDVTEHEFLPLWKKSNGALSRVVKLLKSLSFRKVLQISDLVPLAVVTVLNVYLCQNRSHQSKILHLRIVPR